MGGNQWDSMGTGSTVRQVLFRLVSESRSDQRAHYISAEYFSRKGYWLGIPVIALSTIVGTSVFASIQKQPAPSVQIAVGLASVLAAVLASLQTFLGYSTRVEKHRVAGAKYGALGRELEILRASNEAIPNEVIEELKKRLDALALESPNNSLQIYKKGYGQ